ncbi:Transglycosylase [Gossypium australe]|uniref:Transglycosylase n=1 Tax=Gossypium australe TaxID=47621 RepID=A0A5B6VDJ7_9ROSI|nr:Transglycosylase [Gossypium australe]
MPKELSSPARMSVSFKYWDECADPEDMEAMWNHPEVRTEWTDAGETEGQRVHLSRDPDGQPYLTQTEMRAVAEIVTRRQFDKKLDPEKINWYGSIISYEDSSY